MPKQIQIFNGDFIKLKKYFIKIFFFKPDKILLIQNNIKHQKVQNYIDN